MNIIVKILKAVIIFVYIMVITQISLYARIQYIMYIFNEISNFHYLLALLFLLLLFIAYHYLKNQNMMNCAINISFMKISQNFKFNDLCEV